MNFFIALIILIMGLSAIPVESATGPVVIVHGWTPLGPMTQEDWDARYQLLEEDLESAGVPVHGPFLPKSGSTAGDSVENAEFLKEYIDSNNLDNVTLICHSLGGSVCEWYARHLDEGEIATVILLDSYITVTPGAPDYQCEWGLRPPDQCESSEFRTQLAAAQERADLYYLSVWITINGTYLPLDSDIWVWAQHSYIANNVIARGCILWEVAGYHVC